MERDRGERPADGWQERWRDGPGPPVAMLLLSASLAWGDAPPVYELGPYIERFVPPPGATTHTVVPGRRFEAGAFRRWILGDDYRDLWTTPIEVPVLDLREVGGGLTPLRTGGFGQSVALHFTGEDGRRYSVRSLDKDPTQRLDSLLKQTAVEDVLQDQVKALLPCGALVVDPLLDAAGVLHADHRLVVIPDDPRLGDYRREFAGLVGTLQVHPSEGPDGTAGFAGSSKITSSEKVFEETEKSSKNRVDTRAFLKARLVDFLINDKDRHAGQWRWARYPDGDGFLWKPIPEDRDQAFIDLDGAGMAVVRRAIPKQIKWERDYPSLVGLSISGWEIDRQLLSGVERPVWESVAAEIRSELTDAVIDDAVTRLPGPYRDRIGVELASTLKARRDGLPQYALRYYRLISRQVEITATDQGEYAELTRRDSGDLDVRIGRLEDSGTKQPAYFSRTFHADETQDVRLYLRGGADRIEVAGGEGGIAIHADGGGGNDTFVNASRTGSAKTRFYDSRGSNTFVKGAGAKIDLEPFTRPPAREVNHQHGLDWGKRVVAYPIAAATPDWGLFLGGIGGSERYGYRKVPYASHHVVFVGLATHGLSPVLSYEGSFRQVGRGLDLGLRAEYSGLNVMRFDGFGNETKLPGSRSFYDVEQREVVLAPVLMYRAGWSRPAAHGAAGKSALRSKLLASAGPIVRYSETPLDDNDDKYIGTLATPPYGAGSFGQVGARLDLQFDSRDNAGHPQSGVLLRANGSVFPEVWDVESTFGQVNGTAATYLTARMPGEPTLALRAGGKQVWGTYPFHEAASLGGGSDLRGFWKDRFAGDASLYGNAELRVQLTPIKFLLPGALGVFAAADAGRVFFEPDPSDADEWHASAGGGLWVSFLEHRQTFSAAVMSGDDVTGAYLHGGFMF